MKSPSEKLVPPDGGWGWMVCLGYSFIMFSLLSPYTNFGLLFGDLLKDLEVETTGASLINSVNVSILSSTGLYIAPLIKKLGLRRTGILGSLLSTTGLILTSRATSFSYLIITHSILTGWLININAYWLGNGLGMGAGLVAVNTYFVKKRTQAMGFAMAGSSIGQVCMSQVVYVLLTYYDSRGAILIIGSISLHALFGSCLLQPVSRHLVPTVPLCEKEPELDEVERSALLKPKMSLDEEESMEIKESIIRTVAADPKKGPNDSAGGVDRRTKKSCVQKLVAIFDFDILGSPTFLNLLFGLSLCSVAEVNFRTLLPFFLTSIGMARKEVAFALTLIAITDLVSRLTVPTIVMRLNLRNKHVFWASSLLIGISQSVMAEQKPGKMLTANIVLNGFARGTMLTNLIVCTAENCEIVKLPAAMGMLMVFKGLFIVALGPLMGFIRDYTGSYQICIHSITGMIALFSVTWAAELLAGKIGQNGKKRRRHRFRQLGFTTSFRNGREDSVIRITS